VKTCPECVRHIDQCAEDPRYYISAEMEERCLQPWKVDPPDCCPRCYAEPGEECLPGCAGLRRNPSDWVAFQMLQEARR
jgi:hypothetical protein